MTAEEISNEVFKSISSSTVQSHFHAGMKKLKIFFGAEGVKSTVYGQGKRGVGTRDTPKYLTKGSIDKRFVTPGAL